MLFGLLLLFLFYKFFLKIEAQFISLKPDSQVVEENRANIVWRSVIFYSTLFVMLIMIAPSWMQYIRNFEIHPILWWAFSIKTCILQSNSCILSSNNSEYGKIDI